MQKPNHRLLPKFIPVMNEFTICSARVFYRKQALPEGQWAANWSAEYSVLPDEIQTCKYYKVTSTVGRRFRYYDLNKKTNIHLASPPPEGAVITMTYTPNCIAKDENHVFDMSMTYSFGEYTP